VGRGFAGMAPERQRAIASLGGKAAHRLGTAHEWTPAEAVAFGRKGGQRPRHMTTGGRMESVTKPSGPINQDQLSAVDRALNPITDQATILEVGRHWGKIAAAKGLTRDQAHLVFEEYFGRSTTR
jgi:general stress protein YciG